jgi:hypothetical protein
MTASVAKRAWEWRTFVWAGVIGSVAAWTWTWYLARGATAVMLLVAVAAVVLAIRGTAGVRVALAGLMLAGFVMLLASLYWLTALLLQGYGNVNAFEVLSTAVLPMVAAIVLLLGSVSGFRHASST